MNPTLTIWKTVLDAVDVQKIEIPQGAEFLCAREQHNHACVWYRCNPLAPLESRVIIMVGTGQSAPLDASYLGTVSLVDGGLILHVFESISAFAEKYGQRSRADAE